MIAKLRLKFIAFSMAILVLVFVAVFVMLNVFMRTTSSRQTDGLLEAVAAQDGFIIPARENPRSAPAQGFFVRPNNPELMRAGRFFYVKADSEGNFFETNYEMMFNFTQTEALEYARGVLERGRERGTVGNLQFLSAEKSYGTIIVFAERSIETQMLAQLMVISAWVAGATFVILLALSTALSLWATAPVKAAFDKQRRFISDASHELKTPLTVISTNIDVMQNEIGQNTRLSHMRSQTERMGALIRDLLTLARTDEVGTGTVMAEFDLSRAVLQSTLELESPAFEAGRDMRYELADGIIYTGCEPQIRQLVAILIDNAIRYSDPGGKIEVTLRREGGRAAISVYNTGAGIPAAEKERVFDRFYRSDASRSRETGGYGLGLSIAKAIVSAHRGRITVAGVPDEWVKFTVLL